VTFKGDVTFDTNSAEVRPGLYSEINRVAGELTQYPQTKIRVEGHTDSKGSSEYNLDLSLRRADAVKRLLIQRGVAESRAAWRFYLNTDSVLTPWAVVVSPVRYNGHPHQMGIE